MAESVTPCGLEFSMHTNMQRKATPSDQTRNVGPIYGLFPQEDAFSYIFSQALISFFVWSLP